MVTPAGRQRTLTPLMTISSEHASGAQAVPAGEPLRAEALAIVALRQRHRQPCGCSCLYTGLLARCTRHVSPSAVLPHRCAGASSLLRGETGAAQALGTRRTLGAARPASGSGRGPHTDCRAPA